MTPRRCFDRASLEIGPAPPLFGEVPVTGHHLVTSHMVVFHALRHSHASALIAAGVDIVTVSRRLDMVAAITLTVYAHLFTNTDTTAATAIEAAMRPRP